MSCQQGQDYLRDLEFRRKREVDELAALTGWNDPRYARYIYEYSDRIHEPNRGSMIPFVPTPSDGNSPGGDSWIAMVGLLAFSLISLFWLFHGARPRRLVK